MCHMDQLQEILDALDFGTMDMNFTDLDVGFMDLDLDIMVP